MMTIEEKAKAYDLVLDKAKEWKSGLAGNGNLDNCLDELFPQLVESKDERIRKMLIKYFKGLKVDSFINLEIPNILAWLEKQKEPIDKGEISDGYHTFNELYYYRMLYNAAFFNLLPKELVHKSKKHHDGEECFGGGWFIVMANLPTGQISNHYELNDWDLFQIPEKEIADEWDGHTPQEAAERLHKYLSEKQKEQKPAEWSEEDEKKRDALINGLEKRMGFGWASDPYTREELISWLKSLRPSTRIKSVDYEIGFLAGQGSIKSWKPTEEQLNSLKNCAYGIPINGDGPILRELYNDLKQL